MSDLSQLTLHIRPTHSDTIPANTGRATQAWFLDALRQINPHLSAAIHDGSGPKPFTTSGIYPTDKGDLLNLSKYKDYHVQVTTLHPDVTSVIHNGAIERWQQDGINIHDQPFIVERIDVKQTSYAKLRDQYAGLDARRQYVTFEFCSPTYFKRTGGLVFPLPLPRLVFEGLLNRWRIFSDVTLADSLPDVFEKGIEITKHRIQTRHISYERANRGAATGFVGTATFRAKGRAVDIRDWLALAHFAVFSGIGAGTTYGFGRVNLTSAPEVT